MDIHVCKYLRLGFPDTWNWRQTRVSGPYWRVYWNNAPGAFVTVGGVEIELTSKRIVVLSPRTAYSTRTQNGVWHFYVHFSVGHPYSEVSPGIHVLSTGGLLSQAVSIASDLKRGVCKARTLLRVEKYVCEILLALPEKDIPSEKRIDPRIAQAVKFLEEGSNLDNTELSRQTGMSRTAFCKTFRRETGQTPQIYSRRKRLEKACVALHFESKTIDVIAEESGFYDRYHFERVFKREFGMTPAKYRKQSYQFNLR
jgi:AraC-like DNA-binding protein